MCEDLRHIREADHAVVSHVCDLLEQQSYLLARARSISACVGDTLSAERNNEFVARVRNLVNVVSQLLEISLNLDVGQMAVEEAKTRTRQIIEHLKRSQLKIDPFFQVPINKVPLIELKFAAAEAGQALLAAGLPEGVLFIEDTIRDWDELLATVHGLALHPRVRDAIAKERAMLEDVIAKSREK